MKKKAKYLSLLLLLLGLFWSFHYERGDEVTVGIGHAILQTLGITKEHFNNRANLLALSSLIFLYHHLFWGFVGDASPCQRWECLFP